jgi:hypothetical protein
LISFLEPIMARRAIVIAAILALAPGCGQWTPASLTEKGLKELRSGQYDEAIATCTEALQLDPRDDAAYLYRGRAHYFRGAKGDLKRAVDDFTRAIELDPKSSDAYYSRALVYRDLGQIALADDDDKNARALDGHLHALDRQLPEPLPLPIDDKPAATADAAKPSPESGTGLPHATVEPELRFGKLRTEVRRTDDTPRSAESNGSSTERYDDETAQPSYIVPPRSDSVWGNAPALDPRTFRPFSPLTPPGESARSAQGRVYRPAPTSPFQPRAQAAPGDVAPPLSSPFEVRSPFGQRTPAPTGFTRDTVGPFVPQGNTRQAPVGNPFSNPAVRPSNPRDYIP